MNRRNFIAAVGAVGAICAFPAALFARSKPIHRFHKGSLGGTFRPQELNLLTEAKLNECLALWDKHRTKRPTIVLLSIANMTNLLRDIYQPRWRPGLPSFEDQPVPTELLWNFRCCTECNGGPPTRLQTTIDFHADHFIVIGRSEKDEDSMPIFLKKSDRSKRLILTGITEPAFEMIA